MIKLLRLIKPYRIAVALIVVLAFVQAMANLYLPTLMADIVDKGIVKGDTGYIWQIGGLMTLVTIGGTIAAAAAIFFSPQLASALARFSRARHLALELH